MLRKWFRSDYSVAKELKTKLVTAEINTFVATKLFTIFCNVIHKRGDHRKKLNIFLKGRVLVLIIQISISETCLKTKIIFFFVYD